MEPVQKRRKAFFAIQLLLFVFLGNPGNFKKDLEDRRETISQKALWYVWRLK